MKLVKSIPVQSPDRQQTLLIIPADLAKQCAADDQAEFWETGVTTLRLRFIGPKVASYGKRYNMVRSKGSTQVSIPRPILQDRGLRDGDTIEVYVPEDEPKTLYLKIVKAKR